MADDFESKTDSAEKAYAAAAAAVPAKTDPEKATARPVGAPQDVQAKKPVSAKPAPAAKKPVKKPTKKSPPVAAKAIGKKTDATPKPTITELKEKIMATAKTPEFSKTITDTMSEMQTRAKEAYEKSSEMAGEMTEFAKGNVEALVESSKIFAAGMQDLGKSYAEEAKSAYETATGDMKEMAGVKSPTELFQLQGKLMRRNFDALVAQSSKNTEALVKLANESFAPLSGRMSVAAEKISKAA